MTGPTSAQHEEAATAVPVNADIEKLAIQLSAEFTVSQRYVAASALYYMLIGYVGQMTQNLPRSFDSRTYAQGLRDWDESGCFPEGITDFITVGCQRHRNPSSGGTAAFQYLKQKRYISHVGSYTWKWSPRFKEAAFQIMASRMNRQAAQESTNSISEEVLDCLESLEFLYEYRGHSVPSELYDTLRDDGVDGLTVRLTRRGEELSSDEMAQILMDLKSELS